MATHLKLHPVQVTARSFADGPPQRTGTPGTNDRCEIQPCTADPRIDSRIAIFRPLFIISPTAAGFLRAHDCCGAEPFVFSSAPSETAYGTAYGSRISPIPRIALASARNRAFVAGPGRCGRDARAFIEHVPAHPWMRAAEHAGVAGAPGVIADLHGGTTEPTAGHVVVMA